MAQHLGASKCLCISKESFWRFPVFQALPSVSSKSDTSSRSSRICITPKSWLSRRFYAKTYCGRCSIPIKKYNNVSWFFRRQTSPECLESNQLSPHCQSLPLHRTQHISYPTLWQHCKLPRCLEWVLHAEENAAKKYAFIFLNHSFFGICLCYYWLNKTVLKQNNQVKMSHQVYQAFREEIRMKLSPSCQFLN